MAMTADDMLKLRDKFVTLDDYRADKCETDKRLDCVEKNQAKNDLVVVRIDTQLKVILWVLGVIGSGIIALVIKQFWN